MRPTSREVMTTSPAAASIHQRLTQVAANSLPAVHLLCTVTESDVVRSSQTVRARSIETRRSAFVDGARRAAHVTGAVAAVCDHGIESLTGGKAFGRIQTRDRVAYKGEVGRVHGLEPVDHLILGHERDGSLRLHEGSAILVRQVQIVLTAGTATTVATKAAIVASGSLNCIVGVLLLGVGN